MPLFYFDVYDGKTVTRDEFGVDLDNLEDVAERVAALLPDIARDRLPGDGSRNLAAFVKDEDGSLVHRAALLYRAQTLARSGRLVPSPTYADDLIMRSQEIREKARQLPMRLDSNLLDLLSVIRQAALTSAEIKASMAPRSRGPTA